jgi:2OG-Fe(II) oxygenase superfamily
MSKDKGWSSRLRDFLDEVEPLGTFATGGRIKGLIFPNPIITVEGVGKLGFPLMGCCLELLKSVATRAPYGKGPETIIDKNVRKTWQIDPSKVSICGDLWPSHLDAVVRQACLDLGFSVDRFEKTGIHANLYMMLVYETGDHFTPHRDTEKEDGMFGTLIIQLPSAFTGGAISFEHTDETKTFDLSQGSDEAFKYVAFYADCKHQIHTVESGVRLVLVYNLVASSVEEPPSHSINLETQSYFRSIATDWKTKTGAPEHLGYQLGHKYTPNSFAANSLKGRDVIMLSTLKKAKKVNGTPLFHIWLLLMEYQRLEEDQDLKYYNAPEIGPVLTINVTGTRRSKQSWLVGMRKRPDGWWVDGKANRRARRPGEESDSSESGGYYTDDGMFDFDDREHCEEWSDTGNEGARVEHQYFAAAIVFRPA